MTDIKAKKPSTENTLKNSLLVLKKLTKNGDLKSSALLEHYHYVLSIKSSVEEQIFDYIINKKNGAEK